MSIEHPTFSVWIYGASFVSTPNTNFWLRLIAYWKRCR